MYSSRRSSIDAILYSADCEACVPTYLGWMKRKHDVLGGDARRDAFFCDGAIRAVVLNPQLPTDDVEVDHAPMNTLVAIPADVHDCVMVVVAVDDCFLVDFPVRGFETRVFLDHPDDDLTIL